MSAGVYLCLCVYASVSMPVSVPVYRCLCLCLCLCTGAGACVWMDGSCVRLYRSAVPAVHQDSGSRGHIE
jgi:hypothetical protein